MEGRHDEGGASAPDDAMYLSQLSNVAPELGVFAIRRTGLEGDPPVSGVSLYSGDRLFYSTRR